MMNRFEGYESDICAGIRFDREAVGGGEEAMGLRCMEGREKAGRRW